jgi:hypothetical protein
MDNSNEDDDILPREPLCFEGGKVIDAQSLVRYLSMLAEGKDPDPEVFSKQIDKALKDNNVSRGFNLLSQGMGRNEGQRAQDLLNKFVQFAEGTLPNPNYDKWDLCNAFTNITGIEVDSPEKSNYFEDLLDSFILQYHSDVFRGLGR